MDIFDEAKAILHQRQRAFQITFNIEDKADQQVLTDLAEFCRAHTTTFHPDPRVHAVLEGRREVWLRIQKYLNLNPDQLWELTRKE
jgi:hypothetical protein